MSNRIDFFQPEHIKSAIQAATTSILLDGMLCPFLEVEEIVRAGKAEFSWARLSYNPAAQGYDSLVSAEEIETILGMGKSLSIRQVVNIGGGGVVPATVVIFAGQIEEIRTSIESGGEQIEIIAKDISAKLDRITVYGRRVANGNGSTVFMAGLDTAFNANSKGNASVQPAQTEGETYTVFAADNSESKFWSYAEVITYLLCEYQPAGQLQCPGLAQLTEMTNSQIVRDLDVTGLSLIEALRRCCRRVGLEFRFVSRSASTGPRQAIVFYRGGAGRTVELNCQAAGERLSISKTNIAALHSSKGFWPVTHRFTGQGDFKVYEATFELVKAWDPALEDTDYEKFSPATNSNFNQVKDVYRKWCLNEAGNYSGTPYNQGEPFDFSQIFEGDAFLHCRRRFWPSLSADTKGTSLGYYLEVSYDDGTGWWQYLYAFNNLLDECGIWLSSEQLDIDTWYAALKGDLRFRITASVVSDERLSCTVADGPVNAVAEVVNHIVTLPRQFKYRRVSSASIFANSTDDGIGTPDEADDTAELAGFVRQTAEAYPADIETINIETPFLAFDYSPGDKVKTSPESRDYLNVRLDSRSICWIERVQMDFTRQRTKLEIIRRRSRDVYEQ